MFKNNLRAFVALCFIASISAVYWQVSHRDTPEGKQQPLIVGMLDADAPFMSVNEDGAYEGFDVDIAYGIGKILNRPVEIKGMGMGELFIGFEQRRFDMIMCGLSITSERLKKFELLHYQGSGVKTFPLVFWENKPEDVFSMNDLQGKNITIAVLPGTLQEDFAAQFDGINLTSINSYADIILALQYGRIHAALFDEAIGSYMQKFSQLKTIDVPLGDFESRGHGIGIQKEHKELIQRVQSAIQTLKNNNTIAQLEKRWGMGE